MLGRDALASLTLAAAWALTGCGLLDTYTLDQAKAEAYRAKYRPGCREETAEEREERAKLDGKETPLSFSTVLDVRTRNAKDFDQCYAEARRIWPELEGRVVLKFVIRPDGKVEDISIVEIDTRVRAVACCMVSKVRSWTFPSYEGDERVTVISPEVLTLDPWFEHRGK